MKKGFTLIELISVVIIIGLLVILAIPNINNLVNNESDNISKAMEDVILASGDLYIKDNNEIYPKVEGNTYCIQFNELINKEYLSSPLKDPLTSENIDTNKYIKVSVVNNQYEYSIEKDCQGGFIDTIKPASSLEVLNITSTTVTLKATCIDNTKEALKNMYLTDKKDPNDKSGWYTFDTSQLIYNKTTGEHKINYTINGLTPGTQYTYYLHCRDKAGNWNDETSQTVETNGVYGVVYDDGTLVLNSTGKKDINKTVTMEPVNITNLNLLRSNAPWYSYRETITKVVIEDKIKPTTTKWWFSELSNLTTIEKIDNIDTSLVTSMEGMFFNCSNLESLDLRNFNTENVTNMHYMFFGCSKLKTLNVSSFNTSKVTNIAQMFQGCASLQTLDLSNFNTSNVTEMVQLFYDCSSLTNLNISSFNTSKVTDLTGFFRNCSSLQTLDLRNFDTSNVIKMQLMFQNCSNLETLNVSSFNTTNVTTFYRMFHNCSKLTTLDLRSFNTSKGLMTGMFMGNVNLENIYATNGMWIVSDDSTELFNGCKAKNVTFQ